MHQPARQPAATADRRRWSSVRRCRHADLHAHPHLRLQPLPRVGHKVLVEADPASLEEEDHSGPAERKVRVLRALDHLRLHAFTRAHTHTHTHTRTRTRTHIAHARCALYSRSHPVLGLVRFRDPAGTAWQWSLLTFEPGSWVYTVWSATTCGPLQHVVSYNMWSAKTCGPCAPSTRARG